MLTFGLTYNIFKFGYFLDGILIEYTGPLYYSRDSLSES